MDDNPYESPRALADPQLRPAWLRAPLNGLRAFGVQFGIACTLGFFLLMAIAWQLDRQKQGRSFEYVLMGGVGFVFLGCLVSLAAILIGNVTNAIKRS